VNEKCQTKFPLFEKEPWNFRKVPAASQIIAILGTTKQEPPNARCLELEPTSTAEQHAKF
jgi:hypothetical protein